MTCGLSEVAVDPQLPRPPLQVPGKTKAAESGGLRGLDGLVIDSDDRSSWGGVGAGREIARTQPETGAAEATDARARGGRGHSGPLVLAGGGCLERQRDRADAELVDHVLHSTTPPSRHRAAAASRSTAFQQDSFTVEGPSRAAQPIYREFFRRVSPVPRSADQPAAAASPVAGLRPATMASRSGPYRSILAGPIPWTRASSGTLAGRSSARGRPSPNRARPSCGHRPSRNRERRRVARPPGVRDRP